MPGQPAGRCASRAKQTFHVAIDSERPRDTNTVFIFVHQIFMTHVLGLGPVDDVLRHHADLDGTAFPDGRAANLCNGACCSIACAHFPKKNKDVAPTTGTGLSFSTIDMAVLAMVARCSQRQLC